MSASAASKRRRIFVVAGEHSGDALGAKLMHALNVETGNAIDYAGVGSEGMEAHGLASLFPMADVAVMGPMSILPRLPRIVNRVYATVRAAIAFNPDVVVIIDAPEFTHPIAKRIRRQRPHIPIIDYVSPSVWAWRPGRAKKMKPYVDHVLALLPFEPEAHARLGGPPCTYVGHPLIERLTDIKDADAAKLAAKLGIEIGKTPVLVVLPGSRRSEVTRLLGVFREALGRLKDLGTAPVVLIPAVPSVKSLIVDDAPSWPLPVKILDGEPAKFAAFKLATAALAASGTVTLELALAGTPMVVGYKVDRMAALLRPLLNVHSVILANLVLGENAFPEYLQEDCTPEHLASALDNVMRETPERRTQLAALARIPSKMATPDATPSAAAARIVLSAIR